MALVYGPPESEPKHRIRFSLSAGFVAGLIAGSTTGCAPGQTFVVRRLDSDYFSYGSHMSLALLIKADQAEPEGAVSSPRARLGFRRTL